MSHYVNLNLVCAEKGKVIKGFSIRKELLMEVKPSEDGKVKKYDLALIQ